jgi:hypothetical protein
MTLGNRSEMSTPYAFEPTGGIRVNCTTTSTSGAYMEGEGEQALVTNWGSVTAFVQFGETGVTATTASQAILPNSQALFTIPEVMGASDNRRYTHIAGITDTGATSLQISRGRGV